MDWDYIYPGDHIFYSCGAYDHHGIFCGNILYNDRLYEDVVIHFEGKHQGGKVRGIAYDKFAKGQEIYIAQYQENSCSAPDMVIQKAVSMLNKPGYDLFINNCEHFAHWCKTGKKVSGQVNDAISLSGGLGGGFLAALAVDALLPLIIPELIVIGVGAAAAYLGGKAAGEFTKGLFTDSTNYEIA